MITFKKDTLEKVLKIINRYPEGKQKSALLPILHLAQDEFGGYLSREVLDYVADLLKLKYIEVYEVVTFYSMFYTQKMGKHILEVCQTGPCALKGSDEIINYIKEKLKINIGETTIDGVFTLKSVECLGACGYAPMLQCGSKYFENLNREKIDTLLEELRKKESHSSYLENIKIC